MVTRVMAKQAVNPKILLNIGAGLDIPTGSIVTGRKGESIINGGLGQLTGVVAIGNNFKSTIIHFMALQALNRLLSSVVSQIHTYDTEVNMIPDNLFRLVNRMKYIQEYLKNNQLFDEDISGGLWSITDKTVYLADEWVSLIKTYFNEKISNKDEYIEYECFSTRSGDKLKVPVPTFTEVDSLTEFEFKETIDMIDKNNIGGNETNMIFARQGLAKSKFLIGLPRYTNLSNTYFLFTGQVGRGINIPTGPIHAAPDKKLQHLKNGDKIKGVSDKFFFLLSNCWHAYNAAPIINQGTKLSEYPLSKEKSQNPGELYSVKLIQLRSKSGSTGYSLNILISQEEGVLPTLSEFHNIKDNGRYGISGSLQHYALDLYPDCKLSRTTIRDKINNDKLLRRAINITNELQQMSVFWPNVYDSDLYCTPDVLYKDIKELGYDWNVLLNTREWHAPNQYSHPTPFLSSYDLLRMRKQLYTPYWMEEKTKND